MADTTRHQVHPKSKRQPVYRIIDPDGNCRLTTGTFTGNAAINWYKDGAVMAGVLDRRLS